MRSIHTANQQDYKNNTPYRVIHQHRTKLGNPIWSIIALSLIIPLLSLLLLSSTYTYAESSISLSIDNNDTVLELTVPSSVNLNLTPNSANNYTSFGTTDLVVSAGTNNPTGYTLTMSTTNSTLAHTSGIANGTIIPTIPSVSGSYTLENYQSAQATVNTWACALPNLDNPNATPSYTGVPTTDTVIVSYGTAGNATDTTINFVARVDSSIPAGVYNTTLNFVAIANAAESPLLYMQDVDEWGSTIALGESIRAIDKRDGKTYWVARLCSNGVVSGASPNYDYSDCTSSNLWMTQNLDLGSTSGTMTLTSEDTNLAADTTYTLPRAALDSVAFSNKSKSLLKRLEFNNKAYAKQVMAGLTDYGESYIINDQIYPSIESCIAAIGGADAREFCRHFNIGNHYDWFVAIASTEDEGADLDANGNALYSICPKGWRLPTTHSDTSDFENLVAAYGNITDSDSILQSDPLFFVRSGYVSASFLLEQLGLYGHYWSSTAYRVQLVYELSFSSSNTSSTKRVSWGYGNSVRCISQ